MESLLAHCYDPRRLDLLEAGRVSEDELVTMTEDKAALSRFCYNVMTQSGSKVGMAAAERFDLGALSVVQFWDTDTVPDDVGAAMRTWREGTRGAGYTLFNDRMAEAFIYGHYGSDFVGCYRYCHHPAMRADYFRLAFLLAKGGVYIDADDILVGDYENLVRSLNDEIVICPFVWDEAAKRTVPELERKQESQFRRDWKYYFNNAPLASVPHNRIIELAWARANARINSAREDKRLANIHYDTGPENLTRSILLQFLNSVAGGEKRVGLGVFDDISETVVTRHFQYKNDDRNWRTNKPIYDVNGGSSS